MAIILFERVGTPLSVEIDGVTVPNVEVFTGDGELFSLVLDRRFGSEYVTREELDRWLPLIAHAQAIGAGYSCHGPNSRPVNPFGTVSIELEVVPSNTPTLREVP